MKFLSNRRLKLLREGSFTEKQIDDICEILNVRKPPELDPQPVKVGNRYIYTHNGAYVYVSRLWTQHGREYAELLFVDGDGMFNSEISTNALRDPRYGWWERSK